MYRKQKKIPTFIALLILFAGVTGAYYIDHNSQNLITSASNTTKPEKIHISNVSYQSFTISWLTDSPAIGSLEVKDNGKKLIFLDDMDNDNIPRQRTVHSVSVKNLKESLDYDIKIVSGQRCREENCPVLSQKTLSKKISSVNLPPAQGRILNSDNSAAAGIMVYVVVGQSLPLSTRTDSSGLWVIPLNNLQVESNMEKLVLSDNDLVQITAESAINQSTSAVIDVRSVRQNLSIPPMNIGNTYNFVNLLSKKDMLAKSKSPDVLGTQTCQTSGKIIDILFPSCNGDVASDNRPRFRGTGPKNREIKISVNSSPQTGSVTADNSGAWTWIPPIPLPPGNHTITIGYDDRGKLVTVTKSFIVTKSGEGFVLGIDATPSATLIPLPTVTSPPAPTNGVATPTTIPTMTIIPSATGIPTSIPLPTTIVIPPRTGNWQPTLILIFAGTALLGLGAKILFFP